MDKAIPYLDKKIKEDYDNLLKYKTNLKNNNLGLYQQSNTSICGVFSTSMIFLLILTSGLQLLSRAGKKILAEQWQIYAGNDRPGIAPDK